MLIKFKPMERPSRLQTNTSEKQLACLESRCESGSMEKLPTPDEANSALTVAGSARRAARAPRPMPSWLPPVAGLLLAGGFVNFGLAYEYRDEPAFVAAAVICLVLALLAVASTVRAGGVVPAPAGTPRERTLRQLPALLPFVAGGVGALFAGVVGCLAVAGLGLGALAWLQLARLRNGAAA
ncbi:MULTISPECIES: hypothetical protein [unclassified Streptomyces]|uniref:hypothetical protein n=1 Tax=unclassified Streptomyces TaxID=2593676 RepID=UPI002E111B5E|nr:MULTISPECIES: hypothetical protein [unclassified Streptomyces]WSR29085.1 hypothetical protein OG573_41600 [Streptomyces sp. NBC_01205]